MPRNQSQYQQHFNAETHLHPPTDQAGRALCLRQSETPTTYPNSMAWLNALARIRLEIEASSRRNCRAYRIEKGSPLFQNQAVSVASAAEEPHVTIMAAIVASRCRRTVSLWMSKSPKWLIRHQSTHA